MCAVEYTGFSQYVSCGRTLVEKIQIIEKIEEAVENALLDQAAGMGAGIGTYEFDDGQVRVKTIYRSVQDVNAGLTALNVVKQRYLNQLNGRSVQLRDAGTFNFGGCC